MGRTQKQKRRHSRRKEYRKARSRIRIEERAKRNAKAVVGKRRKNAPYIFAAAMAIQGFRPVRVAAGEEAQWERAFPHAKVRKWDEERVEAVRERIDAEGLDTLLGVVSP